MNKLLEDTLDKLEKSEALIKSERNDYLNKLKSQTIDYQKILQNQSRMHLHILSNQEEMWKLTLAEIKIKLTEKLIYQTQKTEVLQIQYESYLKELMKRLESFQNQLNELQMR